MHVNAETRERLLNAFDGPKNEWWKNVGTPSEAIVLLRKLWQCTDVVPRYYREEAIDWLYYVWSAAGLDIDEDKMKSIRRGCSYAQLVRLLRSALNTMAQQKA